MRAELAVVESMGPAAREVVGGQKLAALIAVEYFASHGRPP
jgi:hypothetical protein